MPRFSLDTVPQTRAAIQGWTEALPAMTRFEARSGCNCWLAQYFTAMTGRDIRVGCDRAYTNAETEPGYSFVELSPYFTTLRALFDNKYGQGPSHMATPYLASLLLFDADTIHAAYQRSLNGD